MQTADIGTIKIKAGLEATIITAATILLICIQTVSALMEAVLPLVSPDLQVVLPPKISLLPKPRPHQKPQHWKFPPAGSMTTMAGGIVLLKILIMPTEQLLSTVPPIYLTVMDICLPAGSS